jgi:hypothetical protein
MFGLGHPQSVFRLDVDHPGDVVTPEIFVARQDGTNFVSEVSKLLLDGLDQLTTTASPRDRAPANLRASFRPWQTAAAWWPRLPSTRWSPVTCTTCKPAAAAVSSGRPVGSEFVDHQHAFPVPNCQREFDFPVAAEHAANAARASCQRDLQHGRHAWRRGWQRLRGGVWRLVAVCHRGPLAFSARGSAPPVRSQPASHRPVRVLAVFPRGFRRFGGQRIPGIDCLMTSVGGNSVAALKPSGSAPQHPGCSRQRIPTPVAGAHGGPLSLSVSALRARKTVRRQTHTDQPAAGAQISRGQNARAELSRPRRRRVPAMGVQSLQGAPE